MTAPLSRRALLSGGVLLGATGWLGACTTPSSTAPPETTTAESSSMCQTSSLGRVLLAYFSRAGENYYYGGRRDLDVGNTEVLARMIAELTEVGVHRIEATEPYPDSYDATVARNVTEQNDDARPGIANPLDSIDGYAMVLLASPRAARTRAPSRSPHQHPPRRTGDPVPAGSWAGHQPQSKLYIWHSRRL